MSERKVNVFTEMLSGTLQKIGMTQAELATRSGLTPAAISQYLSGDREPQLNALLQICYCLKVTPNDLLAFHSETHREMKNEICRLREKIAQAAAALK